MKIRIENGLPIVSIKIKYEDSYHLKDFSIQLGITRETYGFDGILGLDFILYNKLIIFRVTR